MKILGRRKPPLSPARPESQEQRRNARPAKVLVEFFLDEESSPIQAAVVYDADGPNEVETLLGTFQNKETAMLAVEIAKQALEQLEGRPAIKDAFADAQRAALHCSGNLGLPDPASKSDSVESPALASTKDQQRRTDLAANVLASVPFAEQRKRAQRVTLSDQQVDSLLRQLLSAPGNRIDRSTAATALGVPLVQLSGALPMAQRLLNVDQYPVLDRDADGVTIVLNLDLLSEQFGVSQ